MSLSSSLPLSLLLLTAATSLSLHAQEPSPSVTDTARLRVRILRFPQRVRVERPTAIALSGRGAQSDDSVFFPFRAVADTLGFDFAVAAGPGVIIIDVPGYAVHHVPRDVTAGFVLLVPGRRPKLIRGLIDPKQLDEGIRAYLVEVRSLALREQ